MGGTEGWGGAGVQVVLQGGECLAWRYPLLLLLLLLLLAMVEHTGRVLCLFLCLVGMVVVGLVGACQ